jgi:hypothetical protein
MHAKEWMKELNKEELEQLGPRIIKDLARMR